jgi:hypothetical protein
LVTALDLSPQADTNGHAIGQDSASMDATATKSSRFRESIIEHDQGVGVHPS